MDYIEEFKTVDAVINSSAETLGVDAFALSLIKAERQICKLVTHLIYQFPCFNEKDISALRQVLVNNRRVYFEGFEKGFDALYPKSIRDLVGLEYSALRPRIDEAIEDRNKIFHGQLTSKFLNRQDLVAYVRDIRNWRENLAKGALGELQYDGFGRNSFQKSRIADLASRLKHPLADIKSYEGFVRSYMSRP